MGWKTFAIPLHRRCGGRRRRRIVEGENVSRMEEEEGFVAKISIHDRGFMKNIGSRLIIAIQFRGFCEKFWTEIWITIQIRGFSVKYHRPEKMAADEAALPPPAVIPSHFPSEKAPVRALVPRRVAVSLQLAPSHRLSTRAALASTPPWTRSKKRQGGKQRIHHHGGPDVHLSDPCIQPVPPSEGGEHGLASFRNFSKIANSEFGDEAQILAVYMTGSRR
jgi:hypothetical protein